MGPFSILKNILSPSKFAVKTDKRFIVPIDQRFDIRLKYSKKVISGKKFTKEDIAQLLNSRINEITILDLECLNNKTMLIARFTIGFKNDDKIEFDINSKQSYDNALNEFIKNKSIDEEQLFDQVEDNATTLYRLSEQMLYTKKGLLILNKSVIVPRAYFQY